MGVRFSPVAPSLLFGIIIFRVLYVSPNNNMCPFMVSYTISHTWNSNIWSGGIRVIILGNNMITEERQKFLVKLISAFRKILIDNYDYAVFTEEEQYHLRVLFDCEIRRRTLYGGEKKEVLRPSTVSNNS